MCIRKFSREQVAALAHTHTEIHAQRVTVEGSWVSWKNPGENCFNLNKFMSSSAIEEDGRDDGVRSRDVT